MVAQGPDAGITTAGVQGGSGGGGGNVQNGAPAIASFAADRTLADNGGASVVVFSGSISDPNAEKDLATLALVGTGPATLPSATRTLLQQEIKKDEPAEFDSDGFKVWDPRNNDGIVEFRYRLPIAAFAPAGDYTFVATVTDDDGAAASSQGVALKIDRFSLITVGAPIDASGNPSSSWGGWSAAPGATNVAAPNYIRLVNDGDRPDVRVIVDFTEGGFRGTSDAGFQIPINGNLQFAWWEDTTPASSSPTEGTFEFLPASDDGSVVVTFSGARNVIYVAYRIAQMPPLLPQQAYNAAFTVTEL